MVPFELAAAGRHSGYGLTIVYHQLEYLQHLCYTVPQPDNLLGRAPEWVGRVLSFGR